MSGGCQDGRTMKAMVYQVPCELSVMPVPDPGPGPDEGRLLVSGRDRLLRDGPVGQKEALAP
jgi:hypothetical protein